MAVEADDAKEVRATALGVAVEAVGADRRAIVAVMIFPPFLAIVGGILGRMGISNSGEGGDDEELHFRRFDGLFSTNNSNVRV